MSRLVSWFLVVVLLGGFGAAAWRLQARAAAGKEMPPFSVYSEDRNGLAESARLLRKLGWEPVAVTRPIEQTPHQGLLILVEPEPSEMTESQARGLLRWVERGNVLLLGGRRQTALHHELGISLASDQQAAQLETLREATPGEAGGYTDAIDHLLVEGSDTIWSSAGLPLWWLGEQPGGVVLRRGAGRVLVVADPSLLTRRGLRRQDNVLFLYNVAVRHARNGRIYFDEYHHGLHSGGGFWGYLRYHEQQWLLLALALVAAAAGWSLAVRLGPAIATPQERRADALDYASAVARIYQRAGVRHLLARGLARDFLSALRRHLRVSPRALPAEVLATWQQQQPGTSARHLEELLRGVGELRQADVSERRLLTWTQAFDRFRREEMAR